MAIMRKQNTALKPFAHVPGRNERRDGVERITDEQQRAPRLHPEVALVPLPRAELPLRARRHVVPPGPVPEPPALPAVLREVRREVRHVARPPPLVAAADAQDRLRLLRDRAGAAQDARRERVEVSLQQVVDGERQPRPRARPVQRVVDVALEDRQVEHDAAVVHGRALAHLGEELQHRGLELFEGPVVRERAVLRHCDASAQELLPGGVCRGDHLRLAAASRGTVSLRPL